MKKQKNRLPLINFDAVDKNGINYVMLINGLVMVVVNDIPQGVCSLEALYKAMKKAGRNG